jgi:hypothetical protein
MLFRHIYSFLLDYNSSEVVYNGYIQYSQVEMCVVGNSNYVGDKLSY